MKNFLRNIPAYIRHCISKHYPVTPSGMAEAKDAAYCEGYAYWRKYQADICEFCFDGLIIIPTKKK